MSPVSSRKIKITTAKLKTSRHPLTCTWRISLCSLRQHTPRVVFSVNFSHVCSNAPENTVHSETLGCWCLDPVPRLDVCMPIVRSKVGGVVLHKKKNPQRCYEKWNESAIKKNNNKINNQYFNEMTYSGSVLLWEHLVTNSCLLFDIIKSFK